MWDGGGEEGLRGLGDVGGDGVNVLSCGCCLGGVSGCVLAWWYFRARILLMIAKVVVGLPPCVPLRRRMSDLMKAFLSPSIFQNLSPLILLPRRISCLVCPEVVYDDLILVRSHTVEPHVLVIGHHFMPLPGPVVMLFPM